MTAVASPGRMGRGRWLQVVRKLCQVAALLFVVYAALSMHWRNYKAAHNSSRIVSLMTNEAWGTLYRWNDDALALFGDPAAVSDGFLGGPWSATVAGVPLVDPLATAAVAAQGAVPPTAMIVGALLPLLIALLLGKVFCSFLCPGRLLFEVGSSLRQGLLWLGLPLPSVALPRAGLGVGAGLLLFAASSGAGIFHFVLPYLAVSVALHQLILGGAVAGAAGVVLAMLAFDALVAPGQYCRSVCPTGALLEVVGRRPAVVLAREGTEDCPKSCNVCQRVCPYGLFPGRRDHRPACDSCGRCAPACPSRRLAHHARLPILGGSALAVGAAVLAASLVAAPGAASAHHNKGLPHYGYFENYPQVPTDEYVMIDGRWEVGATVFNFQGLQRATSETPNDVRIFAYLYDVQQDQGYVGPATMDVVFDGELVRSFHRLEPNEESVYVARVALPASGRYELRFVFGEQGEFTATLPFAADLAVDAVNWGVIGAILAAVVTVFAVAVVGRRRRFGPRAPAVASRAPAVDARAPAVEEGG